MNNLVVACQTLADEVSAAMSCAGVHYPVILIDSKYHVDPNRLRETLQNTLDQTRDYDNILLAFGCCGNALIDLSANTSSLIIPKTDDCISIMLSNPKTSYKRKKATYFVNKGWLQSSRGLYAEYKYAVYRYGEKRAKILFKNMLRGYKFLMLIDTGAYDIKQCLELAEDTALATNLDLIIEKGSLWYLKQLFTGPHDENFCVIARGETVKMNHFGFISEKNRQYINT